MTRFRVLLVALAAVALLPVWPAQATRSIKEPPPTLLPGAGVSPWSIGQKRRVDPGLLRSVRHARNESDGGCVGFIPRESAAIVDHYRNGFRLAWVGSKNVGYFLNGVAVTKRGARTIDGLVVGKATFGVVRARYPKADVFRGGALAKWGADKLGSTVVAVYAATGYESGVHLFFWFDGSGRLVALETAGSGC